MYLFVHACMHIGTAGSDYSRQSRLLFFDALNTTATINIAILDDEEPEIAETFFGILSPSPQLGDITILQPVATITILSDEIPLPSQSR